MAITARSPFVAVVATVLLVVGAGPAAAVPCWPAPVAATVADPFRPPPCRWCPGNRGIEYATPRGVAVRAVATGRVTFSGTVAGTGYLVVAVAGGLRVSYGNVGGLRYRVGEILVVGAVVGVTTGRLHLGVRDGDRYLDPGPLIGTDHPRPRLVPVGGDRARPAPPTRPRCAAAAAGSGTRTPAVAVTLARRSAIRWSGIVN